MPCEHGRQRSLCKDCGGSGLCEHGRVRRRCKDCGGSGVCEHGRQRRMCKDCGGSGLCEHGRQRSRCKDCGGSGLCEHGRQLKRCRECPGAHRCKCGDALALCRPCAWEATLALVPKNGIIAAVGGKFTNDFRLRFGYTKPLYSGPPLPLAPCTGPHCKLSEPLAQYPEKALQSYSLAPDFCPPAKKQRTTENAEKRILAKLEADKLLQDMIKKSGYTYAGHNGVLMTPALLLNTDRVLMSSTAFFLKYRAGPESLSKRQKVCCLGAPQDAPTSIDAVHPSCLPVLNAFTFGDEPC